MYNSEGGVSSFLITFQRDRSQVLEKEAYLAFKSSYIYLKETEKELLLTLSLKQMLLEREYTGNFFPYFQ